MQCLLAKAHGYSDALLPEYGVGDTPGSGSGCLPSCSIPNEKTRSLLSANSTASAHTLATAAESSSSAGSPECRLCRHRNLSAFRSEESRGGKEGVSRCK